MFTGSWSLSPFAPSSPFRASVQSLGFPAPLSPVVRIVNPLSDPDWDEKLIAFPDATPFHTSAWARVITETYGFGPHYICSIEGDRLCAVLPMMDVRTWATRPRGISLPFTDGCPLLVSNPADADILVAAARDHARKLRWRYLEFRGSIHTLPEPPASDDYFTHSLDLTSGIETLRAGLDSSVRRAIRKAEDFGIDVTIDHSLESMRLFAGLHTRTRRRHGVPPQPWAFFRRIHDHVIGKGCGFIALARQGGQAVAASIFMTHRTSAIFKFGASDERCLESRPNNLVIWSAIEHLVASGARTLHFGRTSANQYGLRRFKRSWGSLEAPLSYHRFDMKSHCFVTAVGPRGNRLALAFRHLPLPLLRLVGLALYRHIA